MFLSDAGSRVIQNSRSLFKTTPASSGLLAMFPPLPSISMVRKSREIHDGSHFIKRARDKISSSRTMRDPGGTIAPGRKPRMTYDLLNVGAL